MHGRENTTWVVYLLLEGFKDSPGVQYKYFYIFAGFMDTLKQHPIGWRLITLTYPISVRCHVLDLILINDYWLALYMIWLSPNSFLEYSGPLHIPITTIHSPNLQASQASRASCSSGSRTRTKYLAYSEWGLTSIVNYMSRKNLADSFSAIWLAHCSKDKGWDQNSERSLANAIEPTWHERWLCNRSTTWSSHLSITTSSCPSPSSPLYPPLAAYHHSHCLLHLTLCCTTTRINRQTTMCLTTGTNASCLGQFDWLTATWGWRT